MLKGLFSNQVILGLAQAGVAFVLALLVASLARKRQIHAGKEIVIAMVRGIVQILAVGSILVMLLRAPRWTGVLLLAGMIIAAAVTSAGRARQIPGTFAVSLYAIAIGAGSVISVMTLAGVIDNTITSLVPVGSMLIANAMNTNALALNRFRADVLSHVGEIEAALALGASPAQTVNSHVHAAFEASLIPAINNLRTLGIVWIPGLMAGMVLSGSPPLYAAIYQFVVIAMIFAASGLTCLISTTLIRARAFSSAEQLVLRNDALTKTR